MTITMMALLEERGKVPHLEISGQHRPAHLVVEYLIMVMMIMIYDHDGYGYPAYSHHDKIPPWWEIVSNDEGGNVPVSKTHHTP